MGPGFHQCSTRTRGLDTEQILPGSDTQQNSLGGLLYLDADRYPFVMAVFGVEVVRGAKGEKEMVFRGAVGRPATAD